MSWIDGIGENTASIIQYKARKIAAAAGGDIKLKISFDNQTEEATVLVKELYTYRIEVTHS